ncbi:hypothetical protein INS49_014504 [Diaporthe citri]|uniref:uncharacterized protein n=1 Tax=Diaporthe citri TaxID=83186 RepID=UPI001C7E907A|nr:uncharacterized protein INS49_014504 [Diaporthe citri]KAG6356630.1 hypothetical protein INS49_014504 [Diaporthe citri]
MKGVFGAAGLLSLLCQNALAVELTMTDDESIKAAAGTIAFGLMKYYTGNNTGDVPGKPTVADESYNPVVTQAMLHQAGDDRDYMPANQTRTEGNDDQGFWAMAAMSAAENRFPDPPPDQPQWLALAQAVFNEYTTRWDEQTCNGGLRWQIFTFNNGFNYKNSISNGCFFNLAARLARFTGNQTYADWAQRVFEWEQGVNLITPDFRIYDGAGVDDGANCTKPDVIQWTYNAGIYMHGSAIMYNITSGGEQAEWKKRLDGILTETQAVFFNDSILMEQACENVELCDTDQQSFKGYLLRWMSGTTQVAPYTFDTIMPLLQKTAPAAAKACSGSPAEGFNGKPGTACGFKWTTGGFDGLVGVGQQMSALSAVMYSLTKRVDGGGSGGAGGGSGGGGGGSTAPVTANTGGTSQGDPNAGIENKDKLPVLEPITMGERVAAGFMTSAIALSIIGGSVFVMK